MKNRSGLHVLDFTQALRLSYVHRAGQCTFIIASGTFYSGSARSAGTRLKAKQWSRCEVKSGDRRCERQRWRELEPKCISTQWRKSRQHCTASVSVNSQRLLMYLLPELFLFSGVSGQLSAAFPGVLCWSGDTRRTAQWISHPLLSFCIRGERSCPRWISCYLSLIPVPI